MRLVLDTNVVVSAMLWDGSPRQLLRFGRSEAVQFFSSPPLLQELTQILSRSKFQAKIVASLLSIGELVALYAELVSLVEATTVPRLASDPDDDVVIGTAIAAKANLIVTGDRAFRALAAYEGGRIVSVNDALQALPLG